MFDREPALAGCRATASRSGPPALFDGAERFVRFDGAVRFAGALRFAVPGRAVGAGRVGPLP
ncbi:MAG: hypothetical protein ABWZ42_07315 [Ilumatobacteraceae bacterium]